jgi:hypothetical protein
MEQSLLLPPDAFAAEFPPAAPWGCVRVRARAEKRLAGWLAATGTACYVPTLARQTVSHRRVRVTLAPVFPGYLFHAGNGGKSQFRGAPGFVDLVPCGEPQARQLALELWQIWRGLTSGSPLELVARLQPGEEVEVVAGALKGLCGRFERWGQHGRLVLWVDLLGAGAAMEIDEAAVVRR